MTQKSHNPQPRIAVFPGSFNPFTVGHHDIVQRGLKLFDHIIVCIGVNINKPGDADNVGQRVARLRQLFADEPRVSVESWSGLTADFVRQHNATVILRGIRSVRDMEYERDLADANRQLADIETVTLFADPRYSWVSSSLVRELDSYGSDTSKLTPH